MSLGQEQPAKSNKTINTRSSHLVRPVLQSVWRESQSTTVCALTTACLCCLTVLMLFVHATGPEVCHEPGHSTGNSVTAGSICRDRLPLLQGSSTWAHNMSGAVDLTLDSDDDGGHGPGGRGAHVRHCWPPSSPARNSPSKAASVRVCVRVPVLVCALPCPNANAFPNWDGINVYRCRGTSGAQAGATSGGRNAPCTVATQNASRRTSRLQRRR